MNVAHLNNSVFRERIRRMWERQAEHGATLGWEADRTLASCLAGAHKIDRAWGKRRA